MARLELPVCVVDLDQHVVERDGGTLALTRIEGRLIGWLAANAGRTVSRDELLQHVWGYRPGVESRTVQSTIHRVREKIEADPADPVVLRTVYGVGYRFDPPQPEDDRLIGRAAALRDARERLERTRLLTIAGPGGVGKTTLARRLADLHDGAVFCDASSAWTADDLVRAVAESLGLEVLPGSAPDRARAIADAAEGVSCLVLDNLEQLDAGGLAILASWSDAPFALLATSRHVLGLPGEVVVDLDPLDPEAAARLFLARARAAHPEVQADDADLRAIVDLADRLPLAIELVAARASLLSVPELRARLEAGKLAIGAGADRRSSLERALRWSWDLLDPVEQGALAQLSAFAGRWTLDAAEAVVSCERDLLETLDGLRRKALVRAEPQPRSAFDMLGTVRRFAAERLAERPDASDVARRHARWVADRGWRLTGLLPGARRDAAAAAADLPDVGAALQRAATLDGDTHARLAIVAFRSLGMASAAAIAAAVERTDASPALHGLLLGMQSHVSRVRGDADGSARGLEEAFAAAGDDATVLCQLHTFRTSQRMSRRAWQAADESARLAEAYAAQGGLSVARLAALANRAAIAWYSGAADAADRFVEVQQLAEQVGDDAALAEALANHGGLQVAAGRLDRALPLLLRAVEVAERLPGARRLGTSLNNLAALYREQERLDEAEAAFRRAIAHLRRGGLRAEPAVARMNLGWIALERGRLDEASAAASEGIDLLGRDHPHYAVEARILAAAAAQARGWGPLAREHYDAALDAIPASDRRRPRLVARRAVLDPATAGPALVQARAELEAVGSIVGAVEIDVLHGLVHLAAGDAGAARASLAGATSAHPGLASPTPAAWSADVRLAVRLLAAALG